MLAIVSALVVVIVIAIAAECILPLSKISTCCSNYDRGEQEHAQHVENQKGDD